jgi:hypothetical protein
MLLNTNTANLIVVFMTELDLFSFLVKWNDLFKKQMLVDYIFQQKNTDFLEHSLVSGFNGILIAVYVDNLYMAIPEAVLFYSECFKKHPTISLNVLYYIVMGFQKQIYAAILNNVIKLTSIF